MPKFQKDDLGNIVVLTPKAAARQTAVGESRPIAREEILREMEQARLEKEFGSLSEGVRAFGEGGLDMLTFGVGSPLVAGIFDEDASDIAKRAQVNPGKRLAGSLTGAAVGLLSGTGASSAFKVATPLGAVTRGTQTLGRAAGGGVSGLALGTGIEGMALGVGQAITESYIEDKPLTAEALAGNALLGGVLGAGAGAAGGLIEKFGNRITQRSRQPLFNTTTKEGQTAVAALNNQLKALDDLATGRVGKTALTADEGFGAGVGKHGPTIRNFEDFTGSVDDIAVARKAETGLKEDLTKVHVRRAEQMTPDETFPGVRNLEEELTVTYPQGYAGKTKGFLNETIEAGQAIDRTTINASRNTLTETLGGAPTGERFLTYLAKAEPQDAFKAMRQYGEYMDSVKKAIPHAADAIDSGQAQMAEAFARVLKKQGKALQGSEAASKLDKLLMTMEVADTAGQAAGVDVNPLPDSIEPLFKLYALGRLTGTIKGGSTGLLGSLFKGASSGYTGRQVAKLAQPLGPGAQSAGFVTGAILGRRGAGELLDSSIGSLIGLQRSNEAKIGKYISMLGKTWSSPKGMPARMTALKAISSFLGDVPDQGTPTPKDEASAFVAKMKTFNRVMSNPEAVKLLAEKKTAELSLVSPELGQMAKDQFIKTLEYLKEAAPREPSGLETVWKNNWNPGTLAMGTWTRQLMAAADPPSVVEKMVRKQATWEEKQVFKTLYPAHFQSLQRHAMANLEKFRDLPKDQQNEWSYFLEIPINVTVVFTPQFQADFLAASPEEVEQAAQSPSQVKTLNQPTKAQELTQR